MTKTMTTTLVELLAALGMLAFCAGFPVAFLVIGTGR